jgi:hypothetical protein
MKTETVLFGGKDLKSSLILHHDNVLAHDTLRVCEFMAKNSITKLVHTPYSPDLTPCGFWLFQKLKNALKGQRFADIRDTPRNVTLLLRGIPENDFQDCFRQWHHRLAKCISKATAAASAQVRKFCFIGAIPGITFSEEYL